MYIHICTVGTVYIYVCFFFCDCPSNESFFNSGNVSLGNRPDSTIKRIKKKKKKKFWYPHKDLCWNVFVFFKSRQVWNRIFFFPLPSTKFQILDGSCKKTSNVLHLSWRLCRRGNTKRLRCMSGRVETDRQTDRQKATHSQTKTPQRHTSLQCHCDQLNQGCFCFFLLFFSHCSEPGNMIQDHSFSTSAFSAL